MSNVEKKHITCVDACDGYMFVVNIKASASVSRLKVIIADKMQTIRSSAALLDLYTTKKGGKWLTNDEVSDEKWTKERGIPERIYKLMKKRRLMEPFRRLDDGEFDFPTCTVASDIHVIVDTRAMPVQVIGLKIFHGIEHMTQIMEGERPPKRRKLDWTTSPLDFNALKLPTFHQSDQTLEFWEIGADILPGFGIPCTSSKLILHCRNETLELLNFVQNDVVRDGCCGYISGPPGTGKSTNCAAIALAIAKTGLVVTWIHLSLHHFPECVRLDGVQKKTFFVHKSCLDDSDLDAFVNDVPDSQMHIVFIDGLTSADGKEERYFRQWCRMKKTTRRLIIVTSMAFLGKICFERDLLLGVREHIVMSWTLEQYFDAVNSKEFFDLVKQYLDAPIEDESSEGDDMSRRKALVKAKHYFAGGSARLMFNHSTADVVVLLENAVQASDIEAIAAGTMGDRKNGVINRLLCQYDAQRTSIVSEYAASAIAIFGGPQMIKKFSATFSSLSNASVDGWMLEIYFFARLNKGGVTVYDSSDNKIFWSECQPQTFDPEHVKMPKTSCWLKPLKFNNGGYDAVYIEPESGLVRFVQVTRAKQDSFRLKYFAQLLNKLVQSAQKKKKPKIKASDVVKTLEIYFCVESETLKSKFTISPVKDLGALEDFGWSAGQEKANVRIVGIDGVNHWNQFNW